jgi:hypothetical protein
MLCPKVQDVLLPEGRRRTSLSMAGQEGPLWSMERHAQKDGGRHLLELVSTRKGELYRCVIPCVKFADEETAPYFGELSCAFDFAESLLPRPVNRLTRSLKDKSSLMAFASTFDEADLFPVRRMIVRRDRRLIFCAVVAGLKSMRMAGPGANRNS